MTKEDILRYVAKTPHNTNPNMIGNMIDALVKGANGGSIPDNYPKVFSTIYDDTISTNGNAPTELTGVSADDFDDWEVKINGQTAIFGTFPEANVPSYHVETDQGDIYIVDASQFNKGVMVFSQNALENVSIEIKGLTLESDFVASVIKVCKENQIYTNGGEFYDSQIQAMEIDGGEGSYFLPLSNFSMPETYEISVDWSCNPGTKTSNVFYNSVVLSSTQPGFWSGQFEDSKTGTTKEAYLVYDNNEGWIFSYDDMPAGLYGITFTSEIEFTEPFADAVELIFNEITNMLNKLPSIPSPTKNNQVLISIPTEIRLTSVYNINTSATTGQGYNMGGYATLTITDFPARYGTNAASLASIRVGDEVDFKFAQGNETFRKTLITVFHNSSNSRLVAVSKDTNRDFMIEVNSSGTTVLGKSLGTRTTYSNFNLLKTSTTTTYSYEWYDRLPLGVTLISANQSYYIDKPIDGVDGILWAVQHNRLVYLSEIFSDTIWCYYFTNMWTNEQNQACLIFIYSAISSNSVAQHIVSINTVTGEVTKGTEWYNPNGGGDVA